MKKLLCIVVISALFNHQIHGMDGDTSAQVKSNVCPDCLHVGSINWGVFATSLEAIQTGNERQPVTVSQDKKQPQTPELIKLASSLEVELAVIQRSRSMEELNLAARVVPNLVTVPVKALTQSPSSDKNLTKLPADDEWDNISDFDDNVDWDKVD